MSNSLTDADITKYQTATGICKKIYKELKDKICNSNPERNLKVLSEYGNNRINEELKVIYKKLDKNIAFPVSISLNDIVSNYIYDYTNEDCVYNTIKDSDIIKIELAVSIDGCISVLCETFTIIENIPINKTIDFLNNIQKDILNMIRPDETVDEIRIFIESKCTEHNVFPVENCTSFQQDNQFLMKYDSKYMILNYRPKIDKDDNFTTLQNINFEFEENDIFTINLSVLPIEDDLDTNDIKYKYINSHIYRFNEYTYALKLKSSRNFYNEISNKHSKYAFEMHPYLSNLQYKMGIKECVNNKILDPYHIITTKNKLPVITKKFTIYIGNNKTKLFK
jgi:methionine aminopeptidase